jgi:hypothetical protein
MNSHSTVLVLALTLLTAMAGCGGGSSASSPAAPAAWGTATALSSNPANLYDGSPAVTIDSAGSVMAVYLQNDGTRRKVMARHYAAASGTWSTAVGVDSAAAGEVRWDSLRTAQLPNGDVIAIWGQGTSPTSLWSNRYSASTASWGTPALLETDDTRAAYFGEMAVAPNGNAVVVWRQADNTNSGSIYANRYSSATQSWSGATAIEIDPQTVMPAVHVAMDVNGNAAAVWTRDVGAQREIRVNRYAAASNSWGGAATIATFPQGAGGNPRIALDASGNAMAVWEEYPGSSAPLNIVARRSNLAADPWAAPQALESNDLRNSGPLLTLDAQGNALVIWTELDIYYGLRSARYDAATASWSAMTPVGSSSTANAERASLIMGTNGHALALWQESDGARINNWANRYRAGIGWDTATLIDTPQGSHSEAPGAAIDVNGNIWAMWAKQNSARDASDVWFNRYR